MKSMQRGKYLSLPSQIVLKSTKIHNYDDWVSELKKIFYQVGSPIKWGFQKFLSSYSYISIERNSTNGVRKLFTKILSQKQSLNQSVAEQHKAKEKLLEIVNKQTINKQQWHSISYEQQNPSRAIRFIHSVQAILFDGIL